MNGCKLLNVLGVSSFCFEGNEGASEKEHGLEVTSKFLKSSGDAAKVFDSGKQVFHQMSQLVQIRIKLWIGVFVLLLEVEEQIQ